MAKHIPRKKTTKKSSKQKALKVLRKRQFVNIGLTLILLFIITSGITIFYFNSDIDITKTSSVFITKLNEINNKIFPKPAELAATVNYEDITIPELDKRYDLFPPEYQQLISKKDVLDQMIG